MRVLVACEFSGVVREAFRALGHEAWSCDLLDTAIPGPHFKCDVRLLFEDDSWGWDLMIAHPPCTHLSVAGAHLFKYKAKEQAEALAFVDQLLAAPIPKIALENPVGVISTRIRKPDQIIEPFWFGHPTRKRTCLWLKNLPKLTPTNMVEPVPTYIDHVSGKKRYFTDAISGKSKNAGQRRSITFQGIADAMAAQWGA